MTGYLHIIIGPMFSGKTSELLNIINKYKILNKEVLVVKHADDIRYDINNLVSHNNRCHKCIYLHDLNYIFVNKLYNNVDIIIVDEFQFFENSYDTIIKMIEKDNKKVIIAGLSGDSLKKPFGDILKLIPQCDKLTRLTALCKKCGDGTEAHFTKRIVDDNNTVLVGTDNEYEAVCRKHY